MSNLKKNPNGSIILYQTEDGQTKVEAVFDGNTIGLHKNKCRNYTKNLNPQLMNI